MTEQNKENQKETEQKTSDELFEAKVNSLARKYRHIGFAIFDGLALVLAGFLAYSAVTALNSGNVFDPFTGERIESK